MIITTAIFRIPMIGNHELLGSLAHCGSLGNWRIDTSVPQRCGEYWWLAALCWSLPCSCRCGAYLPTSSGTPGCFLSEATCSSEILRLGFQKIWGIWGASEIFNSDLYNLWSPYPPYPPYKGGHHLLLQSHFGKTEQQSTHAASPLETRRPPTKTGRPWFWTIQRRAVWKSGVWNGDRRPQVKGSDSSDLFWIYSGFGTVECLGACERALCCMLPWTLVTL